MPRASHLLRLQPLVLAIVAILLAGCAIPPHLDRFEFTRLQMGVQCRIILYAPHQKTAESAGAAAFDRIAELDAIMTDYRPDSELRRLCARAGGGNVPVSDDLFSVLATAQRVSEASDGAFDVTVGPLVALWRKSLTTHTLPCDADLAAARALVGWRNLSLDPAAHTARLARPGMQLDLGGIAKGYAAQAAVGTLRAHATPCCLVALAGDIAVGDAPPGSPGWVVTTRTDTAPSRGPNLLLVNICISTSGNTEQFVDIDGRRYSHIVDPRTGLGLQTGTAATVITPTAALADALATACCVLGTGEGGALVRRTSGAAAIVTASSPGCAVTDTIDPDHILRWTPQAAR